MDEAWIKAWQEQGKALFSETKGIRTRDREEMWLAYVTYVVAKGDKVDIKKTQFIDWMR